MANSASSGSGTLIVNGVSVIQVSNDNTSGYGNCSEVRIGLPEVYNCAAMTIAVDDVKISAQPIG